MYVHSHSVRRFGLNYHQTSFDKYPYWEYIKHYARYKYMYYVCKCRCIHMCNYMWVNIYAIKVYVYTHDSISVRYRNTAGFINR